ncbi:hypothetical protein [Longispora albida]|uniref:hypothetical protein n=1 Tax=Longispora albida TaxID=203523 RepID=UPI00036DB03F|nr:hypothetical protein [Longispora albida]
MIPLRYRPGWQELLAAVAGYLLVVIGLSALWLAAVRPSEGWRASGVTAVAGVLLAAGSMAIAAWAARSAVVTDDGVRAGRKFMTWSEVDEVAQVRWLGAFRVVEVRAVDGRRMRLPAPVGVFGVVDVGVFQNLAAGRDGRSGRAGAERAGGVTRLDLQVMAVVIVVLAVVGSQAATSRPWEQLAAAWPHACDSVDAGRLPPGERTRHQYGIGTTQTWCLWQGGILPEAYALHIKIYAEPRTLHGSGIRAARERMVQPRQLVEELRFDSTAEPGGNAQEGRPEGSEAQQGLTKVPGFGEEAWQSSGISRAWADNYQPAYAYLLIRERNVVIEISYERAGTPEDVVRDVQGFGLEVLAKVR